MAEITAAMVKELREKTDAPMMECKKALAEASGDLGKAEEILRVKLGSKAAKASSRVAAEGIVAVNVSADGKLGTIVEVNCETDFVAKNEDFLAFAAQLAKLVAEKRPADVAALSALPLGEGTVESTRTALVGKIGENMSIRRFKRHAGGGKLAHYLHGTHIGVIVEFDGSDVAAKDVAMQIAASTKGTRVLAIDAKGVPADLVDNERKVAAAKAAESGKPAEIVSKMVEGSVQKFLKEVSLLDQVFVKAADGKQTVGQMLKGVNTAVKSFTLYVVGEGIEKRADDFAAEVAAQVAAAKKV
jgi:elongation factor Ts